MKTAQQNDVPSCRDLCLGLVRYFSHFIVTLHCLNGADLSNATNSAKIFSFLSHHFPCPYASLNPPKYEPLIYKFPREVSIPRQQVREANDLRLLFFVAHLISSLNIGIFSLSTSATCSRVKGVHRTIPFLPPSDWMC